MWNVEDPSLYNADHLVVRHIYESDHAAVVWFGFKADQILKDHETSSTAIIEVLKGRIRLNTATEQILEAGQGVQLEPNERHALTALADSVVQLLLVPHPRYHSLASEVGLGSNKK
ncbi:cupin [Sulfobacillus harzensis]|uniref:Cupin n=1 Tax=Sulfobacillus harzensis TaxID=2729629 RepID=A0A7Y0L5Z4_9FIRM|nr:cupin [Sulfobacillus harzensis]NMP23668.1 cupin [Sulfobacillus harzensis]